MTLFLLKLLLSCLRTTLRSTCLCLIIYQQCLQACLHAISSWSDHWQLTLFPSKSTFLHVAAADNLIVRVECLRHVSYVCFFHVNVHTVPRLIVVVKYTALFTLTVASIQSYTEGTKFFLSQGRGRSFGPNGWSLRPVGPIRRICEARKAESGVGFLGKGQQAPPHQLGGVGRAL